MTDKSKLILIDQIEPLIHTIRGQTIMLDSDLAVLYGVPTKVLNQAVKRNRDRFPDDFLFQLDEGEYTSVRSQSVILKRGGNVKYPPYAFTEQGVAMLSSVLNSDRAIAVNIEIMRAFVKLRRLLASHAELARKLETMEKKYDAQFKMVFDAIRQMMAEPEPPPPPRMGFHTIRDAAETETKPPKPTASIKPPRRRRTTD